MSLTALLWILLAGFLLVRSFGRPVWAIGLYLLTFFAAPHLWWWGRDIPDARYALIAAVVLALTAILRRPQADDARPRIAFGKTEWAAIGLAVNATAVHLFLATRPELSVDAYAELIKFVLLFFLFRAAIRDQRDLRIVLIAIGLGAAYIGFEVTVNDRGTFTASRLEGVGAPGADTSNALACLMLVVLPLVGGLVVGGTPLAKLSAAVMAPLILNVILLCNSRGAFVGLIGGGLTFVGMSRGPTRKKAIGTLLLGAIALFFLLGDPKILDRFGSTFVSSDDLDSSAAGRLDFWRAGLLMVADYPLGAGGEAFKTVHAETYLRKVGNNQPARSIHNSYLTEATDWGIQGLLLKMLFFGGALLAAYRTSVQCRKAAKVDDAVLGIAVVTAGTSFLIAGIFGSFFSSEWVYWLAAVLVRYAGLYSVPVAQREASSEVVNARSANVRNPLRPWAPRKASTTD